MEQLIESIGPNANGNTASGPIDCVLFDLDGVVYHGPDPVPGAVEGITFLHAHSVPVNYVTNNAARPPEVVAAHITQLGIRTTIDEITTSAQVLAANLRERYGHGAPIFMVGAAGLSAALEAEGLRVVRSLEEAPVAFAQGLDPEIDYNTILIACRAIRSGLDWWASNPDYSMPGPGGQVPGNGAFVEMLCRLTDASPTIVGKPAPHMMRHAASRLGAGRPLMVGDRLDTDIEGGNNAGFETALVLTGVHDIHDALAAPRGTRPTYILPSLRGLEPLILGSETANSETADTTNADTADAEVPCRILDGELRLSTAARSDVRAIEAALRLAWDATDRGLEIAPGNLPRRISDPAMECA